VADQAEQRFVIFARFPFALSRASLCASETYAGGIFRGEGIPLFCGIFNPSPHSSTGHRGPGNT